MKIKIGGNEWCSWDICFTYPSDIEFDKTHYILSFPYFPKDEESVEDKESDCNSSDSVKNY